MALNEDIHPKVAQKLLQEFLDADLHYHLNGTPHHVFLMRRAGHHLGQTKRLLKQVADLGEGSQRWMAIFIESMAEEDSGLS